MVKEKVSIGKKVNNYFQNHPNLLLILFLLCMFVGGNLLYNQAFYDGASSVCEEDLYFLEGKLYCDELRDSNSFDNFEVDKKALEGLK